MRISDWSSDVCSSDLALVVVTGVGVALADAFDVVGGERDLELRPARAHHLHGALEHDLEAGQLLVAEVLDLVAHLGGLLDRCVEDLLGPRLAGLDDLCALDHRSEEHTSELQSLMRISHDVLCLKNKTKNNRSEHYFN